MAMPFPGLPDQVQIPPGEPPHDAGEQDLQWVIDGPQSSIDWPAKDHADTLLTVKHLLHCVPAVLLVYLFGFLSAAPDALLWWAGFLVILYCGCQWLYRFATDRPARPVMLLVTALGVVVVVFWRTVSDTRLVWLGCLPATLAVIHLVAGRFADGFVLWTTCLLTAGRAERMAAARDWRANRTWPETLLRLVPVAAGYLASVLAVVSGAPDFFALIVFEGVTFFAWCLVQGGTSSPLYVLYVTWRMVKLGVTYNAPLPSGRVRVEPFTFQMPGLARLAVDRQRAVLGVVALTAITLAPLFSWPAFAYASFAVDGIGPWVLASVRFIALCITLSFLVPFTVLFAGYGASAADHWDRFAAAAVARAERRSS